MNNFDSIVAAKDDAILVTGAAGFIGRAVVRNLVARGFHDIRCLVRSAASAERMDAISGSTDGHSVRTIHGNLLSRQDCVRAIDGARVIFHLAAGRGEKSYPDAFLNSVVTTRNLLGACLQSHGLRRFVNVSSFAVYDSDYRGSGGILDESCPIEPHPEARGDAYCFAKTRQDQLVAEYRDKYQLPCVTLRPGWVYGPGNLSLPGRVGIGTFGLFLHLGGSNTIPLSYVENCAEAIVLAGLTSGIDGEEFNVVDDDPPTSRQLLRLYKKHVKHFPSLYVPGPVSYGLCALWERYSSWSKGQLPPVFNRKRWNALWRKRHYTNLKLKTKLGWEATVPTHAGLLSYFQACRAGNGHA
jgi:nucleoside-diphosphate-sugar epimerase